MTWGGISERGSGGITTQSQRKDVRKPGLPWRVVKRISRNTAISSTEKVWEFCVGRALMPLPGIDATSSLEFQGIFYPGSQFSVMRL